VDEAPALLVAVIGAELDLGCSSVGTDDPVELGPDGSFAFSGRMQLSGLAFDPPRATVEGRVHGDAVTLTLDFTMTTCPHSPTPSSRVSTPGSKRIRRSVLNRPLMLQVLAPWHPGGMAPDARAAIVGG
jgi:hypothetical protein